MAQFRKGPILKNLNAVVKYSSARFRNEYRWQDIRLSEKFKRMYSEYLKHVGGEVSYNTYSAVITLSSGQQVFVDNQWFALASYFVDFCTEILTYRNYFLRIARELGQERKAYATRLRSFASASDKSKYVQTAKYLLEEDFPGNPEINQAAMYLWQFASDYSWWHGSKTVDRNDFFKSSILSLLNVVNVSHDYLADIVYAFSTDLNLRYISESLDGFTVDAETNFYVPEKEEQESYREAEAESLPEARSDRAISISAASLERFKSV
jgi:hypothetical protein